MGFAVSAAVAQKSSFRKSSGANVWHFCSNCEAWPNSNFEEKNEDDPPLDGLCPDCVQKQKEATCKRVACTALRSAKKILIIDDHPDVRRVLTITLRHMGYETREACDGCAGFEMSLAEHPDLILMDLSLPDSSGLETAKRIRENSKTSQIPIVACSGWKSDEVVAQAMEAGIAEFLAKPISAEVLAAVIKKLT